MPLCHFVIDPNGDQGMSCLCYTGQLETQDMACLPYIGPGGKSSQGMSCYMSADGNMLCFPYNGSCIDTSMAYIGSGGDSTKSKTLLHLVPIKTQAKTYFLMHWSIRDSQARLN